CSWAWARQLRTLSDEQKERIFQLSDWTGTGLEGILATNCFQTNPSERVLCPQLARFNHSCASNCQHSWDEDAQLMRVFACKHIAEGEELCVDYIDVRQSRRARQAELSQKYGFPCGCTACTAGGQQSDERR
ncbi:unnamed protein product, partial [Effrenium voratum]